MGELYEMCAHKAHYYADRAEYYRADGDNESAAEYALYADFYRKQAEIEKSLLDNDPETAAK